jgi:hypothetical protein
MLLGYLRCLRAPTYLISVLEGASVCNKLWCLRAPGCYVMFLRVAGRHLLRKRPSGLNLKLLALDWMWCLEISSVIGVINNSSCGWAHLDGTQCGPYQKYRKNAYRNCVCNL